MFKETGYRWWIFPCSAAMTVGKQTRRHRPPYPRYLEGSLTILRRFFRRLLPLDKVLDERRNWRRLEKKFQFGLDYGV